MKSKKNIVLIGMMGSGKSSIGKILSKKLNVSFIDIDRKIEEVESLSISDIFKKNGEKYFRKIEEKISLKYLKSENNVISLGGGSIVSKKIRKIIKQNSYSIYLKVKFENLQNRLKFSTKRPLLNKNLNNSEILKNILEDRKKYYEKADLIINNDSDKFQTLKKIKSKLNFYAN